MHEPPTGMDWQPAVVAAGSSTRFGAADKLHADLCGRPVLLWSLQAMLSVRSAYPLLLVVGPTGLEAATALMGFHGLSGRVTVVAGGPRRRDSVANAMRQAVAEYVAIHDGARPLATPDLVRRVLQAATGRPGAAPAVPLDDTVALLDGHRIAGHPDRSSLRGLQTPQVVRRADWLEAAALDDTDAPDDTALLARLGHHCVVTEGDPSNLKITRPADLAVARGHLVMRGEPCSG